MTSTAVLFEPSTEIVDSDELAHALFESLQLYCEAQPLEIKGSTVSGGRRGKHDDGVPRVPARKVKERTASRVNHNNILATNIQVSYDFALKLRWVRSADNKEADEFSRADKEDYVRLSGQVFEGLWREWGGFDLDMMATTPSAQRTPKGFPDEGEYLPFFSRYDTEGSPGGVDVYSQDVPIAPSSERE